VKRAPETRRVSSPFLSGVPGSLRRSRACGVRQRGNDEVPGRAPRDGPPSNAALLVGTSTRRA
jgi:hypothetical protein